MSLTQANGTITIRIKRADLVDPAFIAQIQIQALTAIDAAEQPRVLLDLTQVRLASSAAVGLTLALHRATDERNGQLAVVVKDEGVGLVFKRCRVDTLIPLHDSAESALRRLARQG